MPTTTLCFIKPGLQTLVQDRGRAGHQAYGVPLGGALDRESAMLANRLVGNTTHIPVLEMTLLGPGIAIEGNCQIAITGANMQPHINGKAVPMYETVAVEDGAQLSFGRAVTGCRSYMAVRGKWQVRAWLDSCSAASHSADKLTPDSIVGKNSKIHIYSDARIAKKIYPAYLGPIYLDHLSVEVWPGPEFTFFSEAAIQQFFTTQYTVSVHSNRMGYRLGGPALTAFEPKEIISSGIVPGTVQVLPSGLPVVLLADAQTTGGYPRIANALLSELDKIAQLRPGNTLSFVLK